MDDPCFQEAYGFRPNGPNASDKMRHGIYEKDLNGDSLDELTDAMIRDWGITITLECRE
jgi:cytochrome c-type biogenesis protein CcmH/NrfF